MPDSSNVTENNKPDAGVVTSRNIGGIIAQVTVSEEGQDELEITSHPVEMGAQITDHSFKRQAVVTIRAGWSDSNPDGTSVRDIYAQFLALQASRQPISVITGKRSYASMLIRSVTMAGDQASENSLFVTAVCQEIILVSTSTVAVADKSKQADASRTGGVNDKGSVQTAPAAANKGPSGIASTVTV